MESGDHMMHWHLGECVVVCVPECVEHVPDEWQHDWQSVVLVREVDDLDGVVAEWVLSVDLDECE